MSENIDGSSTNKVVGYVLAGLGIALMMAMLPFYLASGLMAPMWAIIVLLLIWVTLFGLALHWFRRHPVRVLMLPLLAAGIWFGAMYAGEGLLGWTA